MQKDRSLQTFLDLVRIYSPTGYEEKARDYVLQFVRELGLKPIQDARGNLIIKVNGVGESLLLGAHLDTVEPGKNIKPQIVDGIIKSSGDTILGADNKVAVAAILEVLKFIIENKAKTKPLDVVFTLSEESGDPGSSKLDYEKISAKKGYIFDSLSPLGTIITASPFYNRFIIKVIGRSVHASTPGKGINALRVLSDAVGKIKLGKVNDKTIANIGIVNSGNGINIVPGEATIEGEVRSFIEKDVEEYSNLIVNEFREVATQYGGKIGAKIFRENPGYEYLTDDGFVKTTGEKIKDFGLKPAFVKKWACSDANIFNSKGMQILNLGDGVIGAHTAGEKVSVSDLSKLTELILFLVSCED